MRVAYVCLDPGVPVFGCKGSSVHCQEVIRVFLDRGVEVSLFAQDLGAAVPGEFQSLRVHVFDDEVPRDPAAREQRLAANNPLVLRQLSDAGPFDLIYERFSLWNNAAMAHAHGQGIPGILEVNSPLIHEQKTFRRLIDESLAKTMQAQAYRHATSIIAVSDEVADSLRANYLARYKTTVVPNGVNCRKFPLTKPDRSDNQPINIGFVGTLKPWHGTGILLDAFEIVKSQNPNTRLTIVGDGPEREKLVARSSRFSADVRQAVQWLGSVPNGQVPELLNTFDIAVAPYPDLQDFYFSPLKILEYMAAGVPTVASRIGQIPSLIDHQKNGLLVDSGSTEQLATAILQLSRDPQARAQMGIEGRRKAETQFTWEHVVDRILQTVPSSTQHCGAAS